MWETGYEGCRPGRGHSLSPSAFLALALQGRMVCGSFLPFVLLFLFVCFVFAWECRAFFFSFLKNRVVALRTLTVLYNPPSSVSLRTFSSPQKKPSCRIPLTRDIRDRTRGRNGGCQRLSREREVGVHRSMGTKLPLRKVSEFWRQSTVVPRGCRHRAAHLQACEEGTSHAKCAYHKKKEHSVPIKQARPAPFPPALGPYEFAHSGHFIQWSRAMGGLSCLASFT